MNCEDFNDRLPEFLEDTLSTADQAAAREHVRKCVACRQASAQQEALAKTIRLSFQLETQRLSLHPTTKQNILNALKRREFPPTVWESVQAFFAVLRRHPASVGSAFLCLVLLITGGRFYLDSAKYSPAQATLKDNRITYDIDIPIQTEMHVFRRQNNMVVDAVVTESSAIDASFSENMRSSPSLQPRIN
jgi:predicted anti-sigma-YlaC factor YlaD